MKKSPFSFAQVVSRSIKVLIILTLMSTSPRFSLAQQNLTPAGKLALVDGNVYQPRHYQFVIDKLKAYTTTTNEELIAGIISMAQSDLEKEFPGITVYAVALGIKKTTETFYDQDRGKKQDLRQMAAFYMTAKQLENRGIY